MRLTWIAELSLKSDPGESRPSGIFWHVSPSTLSVRWMPSSIYSGWQRSDGCPKTSRHARLRSSCRTFAETATSVDGEFEVFPEEIAFATNIRMAFAERPSNSIWFSPATELVVSCPVFPLGRIPVLALLKGSPAILAEVDTPPSCGNALLGLPLQREPRGRASAARRPALRPAVRRCPVRPAVP
ncbi:hypothetical protein SAMN05443551_3667 [Marivita hallyeonensis]|uniref:Uncharacterized protein n=1 Tax=Marivita hallyeonensis TaxID=996342 RepID=A0A1M5X1N2_9RHOB|nr:hypothetical protein SAMN05443551_3667 [Marivita hallyeonensis]